MPNISEKVSSIDFEELRSRLLAKYIISIEDSYSAIDYLRCFLDLRLFDSESLIVLPQLADWAWHEFILDTREYARTCEKLFGIYLHHVASPCNPDVDDDMKARSPAVEFRADVTGRGIRYEDPKAAFRKTRIRLNDRYGIEPPGTEIYWTDAGWKDPAYRLRDEIQEAIQHESVTLKTERLAPGSQATLGWLVPRLVQRLGVDEEASRLAVRKYARLFSTLDTSHITFNGTTTPVMLELTWQEHILWTSRYKDDCTDQIGRFLHHNALDNYFSLITQNSIEAA